MSSRDRDRRISPTPEQPADDGVRVTRRRALGGLAAALFVGPALAGCQMRPLYGVSAGGESVRDAMAAVEVTAIPGRVGQRIRNELRFAVTGGGHQAPTVYRLEIAIRESETGVLVKQTGDVTAQVFSIEAKFKLYRNDAKEPVFGGATRSKASYDKFDPIFTNVRAKINAEDRAAKVIADAIRTRIAAYLSSV